MSDEEEVVNEEEVLSEEEVNALTGKDEDSSSSESSEELYDGEVVAYNFQQPEHTKRGHFPTLQLISEKAARELREKLEFMLQQKIEVSACDITINKFGEFVNALSIPIDIRRVGSKQLDGSMLVCFDSETVDVVIEEYFGAPATVPEEPDDEDSDEEEDSSANHDIDILEKEEFTTAETRISKKLLSYVIASMEEGWSLLGDYTFTHEQSESNPKLINYLDHNELIVNINYEIELRARKCLIKVGIPYKTLDKVKHKLRRVVQNIKRSGDKQWLQKFYDKMQVVPMEFVGELSRVTLPVKKLTELKKGDVINFPKPENITVYINKAPVLIGHIGESNGQAAIQIQRWIKPKK